MMSSTRTFWPTQLTGLAFILTTSFAQATEGYVSRYLPSFYGDFGMGITAASGYYLDNYLGYRNTDSAGLGYNLGFELPGIVVVTDTKIATGKYTFAFYPTALYHELKVPNTGATLNTARGGAGDMYAVPIKLSWDWETVSFGIFSGIVIPTGTYEKSSPLNAGRNYWTFDNNAVFTWHPAGGYQLSLDFGYMVNTENKATHYRTGDEMHLNYLVGYALNDSVNIGVLGSYYRQLLPDTGSGVGTSGNMGEASTIGPVASYTVKLGERHVFFSLKWLHEYNVRNRDPSDYVMLRTAFKF